MLKNVIITGATGMIGAAVLDRCLDHPEVGAVTVMGRRRTGTSHPKLREFEVADFAASGPWHDALAEQDVAFFCLGAYTGSVPDKEFRRITVDLTLAFATALRDRSPSAGFALLSGMGADQTERSRIAFARYKGMAENGLTSLGFPQLHLFRPAFIYPVEPRQEPNFSYRVMRGLYPLVSRIYPNIGVSSEQLAGTMIEVCLDKSAQPHPVVWENEAIRNFELK